MSGNLSNCIVLIANLCTRNCTNGIFISVLAVTVTYDRYTCILLASRYEVFFINSYNQDCFSSSYKNISSSSPVNSDHTSAKRVRNIFKSCVYIIFLLNMSFLFSI